MIIPGSPAALAILAKVQTAQLSTWAALTADETKMAVIAAAAPNGALVSDTASLALLVATAGDLAACAQTMPFLNRAATNLGAPATAPVASF